MTDDAEYGQATDQKEAHRLGTINRWDPPEGDWAAEYDWTRYRGPQAYPVPEDWVLGIVEADGIMWYHYPGHGQGHAHDNDVHDAIEDRDAIEDARDVMATLGNKIVEDSRDGPVILEQQFTIDGHTLFRRVDPSDTELWSVVGDALNRYSQGDSAEEIADALKFLTGSVPADIREEREQDRRREENNSLGDFA